MESEWSGDSENAFFSADRFDKQRTIATAESEASLRNSKNSYYVLAMDVGRYRCTSEVVVLKVTPQLQGVSVVSVVNLYSYDSMDFEEQAIKLKQLYYKFQARTVVIDANGIGGGFVDILTKSQTNKETGDEYPPFGVVGGSFEDATQQYKHVKGGNVEECLYLIKANLVLNTEAHSAVQTRLFNGKIHFLIDEIQAKNKLLTTVQGQTMDAVSRNEYLQPYVMTTILRNQMLNLVQKTEGVNISLVQSSKTIPKDKFSASTKKYK